MTQAKDRIGEKRRRQDGIYNINHHSAEADNIIKDSGKNMVRLSLSTI